MSVQYPNKTYVLDRTKEVWGLKRKQVIIVTAVDIETAAMYIRDKLDTNVHPNELTWLMDTNHTTIYDQSGKKPLEIQAKILYNTVATIS